MTHEQTYPDTSPLTSKPFGSPHRPRQQRSLLTIAGGAAVAVVAIATISMAGDAPADMDQLSAVPFVPSSAALSAPPSAQQFEGADRERDAEAPPVVRRPAYLIIQDEIDAAVAERKAREAESTCDALP